MSQIRERVQHDDAGISLVEILVAMTMLAVVLSASASTLIASFTALAQNEVRTRGAGVGNEVIEELRAIPWIHTGFYASEFSADVTATSDTVILGATRTEARPPRPVEVIQRDGVTYRIVRTIEWWHNDYKRLQAEVSWTDRTGRRRSFVSETVRAALPTDQVTSDFALSHYDASPNVVLIHGDSPDPSLVGQPAHPTSLAVDARTRAAADFVEVSYVNRDGVTPPAVNLNDDGGKLLWSRSLFGGRYPNGDVGFTFRAVRALPVNEEFFGTKIVRFYQPLRFRSITVDPPTPAIGACLAADQATPALSVRLDVDGVVSGDDPVVLTLSTGEKITATPVGATVSGTQLAVVIPSGYPDAIAFTATASRLDSYTTIGTYALTAQDKSLTSEAVQIAFNRAGATC